MSILFKKIYDTRSLHYIDMLLECPYFQATPEQQGTLAAMKKLVIQQELDEIHALAAEALDRPKEAAAIRRFIAAQALRPAAVSNPIICDEAIS